MLNIKSFNQKDVKKFVDYWIENSDNLCDCCNNYHYIQDCKGKDCEFYYKLTEEEVELKGLMPNMDFWDCTNTDDFEFCKVVQESPCYRCVLDSEIVENLDWNGKVI